MRYLLFILLVSCLCSCSGYTKHTEYQVDQYGNWITYTCFIHYSQPFEHDAIPWFQSISGPVKQGPELRHQLEARADSVIIKLKQNLNK